MQAIPSFGGFYHPALHRTASQLISQREAARKVYGTCASEKAPSLHLAGFCA